MNILSYLASYSEQKKDVDARLKAAKGTDEQKKEQVKKELINAVRNREVIYGTLAGGLPPLIGYPSAVDFVMKNSYRVPLVCSLGILYGRYTEQNKKNFDKLFKYDLYVLFAGKDSSGNFLLNAVVDVDIEALVNVTEKIATKYGMKAAAKGIPIVGTLWGLGKGAWDANSEIQQYANEAVEYYTKSAGTKVFETVPDPNGTGMQTLVGYNGKGPNVTIPDNVTIIGKEAFKGKPITSVTLHHKTTTIEASAFENCASLTTVTIPSNTSLKNIGANAFKGTNLKDDSKKALRKWYTGEGVGKGVTGVTFQNNTKTTVQIIQRKSGSTWTTVSAGSLQQGAKFEGVNLAPGTYDLRLSTSEPFPKTIAVQKNSVKVIDGTIVTFTENDKYKITRADYQEFIQRRCNFSDPKGVWTALNTHSNADDLYRVWAESYPKDGYFPYPRPSGKTDQDIITAQCKFSNPKAVWDAAAKHSNTKELLQ
jgi:hypothetical protein